MSRKVISFAQKCMYSIIGCEKGVFPYHGGLLKDSSVMLTSLYGVAIFITHDDNKFRRPKMVAVVRQSGRMRI